MKRALVTTALASVLVLAGACSGDSSDESDDSPTSGPTSTQPLPGPERLGYEAAHLCTAAINSRLVATDDDPRIPILEAIVGDDEPSPAQIEEWAVALRALVDRHESIKAELNGLSGGDKAEREAWQAIVASGDATLVVLRDRLELLEGGDWAAVVDRFVPGDGVDPDDEQAHHEALATLGLERSDCVAPYATAAWEVPEENAHFVREVTETCTRISVRRQATEIEADTRLALDVLADVYDGGFSGTLPDGIEEALERLIQEWEQTTADFEAVNPTHAVDIEAWQATVDASREHVTVHEARLEAARDGSAEAIDEAWQPIGVHAGDWAANGLRARSCAGVSF